MTTDSALSYHPTESLILPTKRRFFPFKIPNFHQQLRHYISTADPDRIYVVADRVVFSIHISSQKRETLALIPFEPKCLAAGYGWIGIGGSDHGECAFVRISDQDGCGPDATEAPRPTDVDSALPIDLDTSTRWTLWESLEEEATSSSPRSQLPEVQLHKFGGTIVNSVTIHRLPSGDRSLADEDIVILSNNDKTVTIYSLTRSKVIKVLTHPHCMNYAVISPDSSILAAVGDETHAYFYSISRQPNTVVTTENSEKIYASWTWDPLCDIEMDIGTRSEDKCCFTVAFSQFSRLCAIGSQSGVITVFDVETIRDLIHEPDGKNPILCHFNSSRPSSSGGAVRCMTFAPEPWDLLVWLEDKGRAGIADVRQGFVRRQILHLELNESEVEEVHTELLIDDPAGLDLDVESRIIPESQHELDAAQRAILDSAERPSNERVEGAETPPLREDLIQDLTERERLIIEVLNTARLSSRLDGSLSDRRARIPANNTNPHSGPRPRFQGSTDRTRRISRPTSPLPVVLSQSNNEARSRTADIGSSTPDPLPSITLSWTTSPAELQSAALEYAGDSSSSDPSSSGNESGTANNIRGTVTRPSANFDYSNATSDLLQRSRNHQRSRSNHRRTADRHENAFEIRHEPSRPSNSDLRASVAAERLRRQRQIISEAQSRNSQREQRYRQQSLGFDQSRPPRWIRSVLNELPDRGFGVSHRDQDPSCTAGLGWGADGRTLYVATVGGIFEYQVNVVDRKTFPVITYR